MGVGRDVVCAGSARFQEAGDRHALRRGEREVRRVRRVLRGENHPGLGRRFFKSPRGVSGRGSVRVKVDPTPTLLTTDRLPFIARAKSRLIARPNPVPSWALLRERPSCTNGSKIASILSSWIPTPVSVTWIDAVFSPV